MIGVINDRLIFDFREMKELLYALNSYMQTKVYSNYCIMDTSFKEHAAIINGEIERYPKNLTENNQYYILSVDENGSLNKDNPIRFYYKMWSVPEAIEG